MNKIDFEKLVNDLPVSHLEHNFATRNPFYCVQKKEFFYGMESSECEFSIWADDEGNAYEQYDESLFEALPSDMRHKINDKALKEQKVLFEELTLKDQEQYLRDELRYIDEIGNLSKRYGKSYWNDISWHLTYQDAKEYIDRRSPSENKFRVYAHAIDQYSLIWKLIDAIKNGDLVLKKPKKLKNTKGKK